MTIELTCYLCFWKLLFT